MASTTKKLTGPTSTRVAANLLRLRKRRGMSTYDVARRLEALNWPIAQTGIHRTENGKRQVDVDDLIALAAALGVSPNALLLPETVPPLANTDAEVEILPGKTGSLGALWAWMTGEMPLMPEVADPARAEAEYVLENKPHRFALRSQTGSPVMDDYFKMQALVIEAMRHGTTSWQLRTMFEQALVAGLNSVGLEGPDAR